MSSSVSNPLLSLEVGQSINATVYHQQEISTSPADDEFGTLLNIMKVDVGTIKRVDDSVASKFHTDKTRNSQEMPTKLLFTPKDSLERYEITVDSKCIDKQRKWFTYYYSFQISHPYHTLQLEQSQASSASSTAVNKTNKVSKTPTEKSKTTPKKVSSQGSSQASHLKDTNNKQLPMSSEASKVKSTKKLDTPSAKMKTAKVSVATDLTERPKRHDAIAPLTHTSQDKEAAFNLLKQQAKNPKNFTELKQSFDDFVKTLHIDRQDKAQLIIAKSPENPSGPWQVTIKYGKATLVTAKVKAESMSAQQQFTRQTIDQMKAHWQQTKANDYLADAWQYLANNDPTMAQRLKHLQEDEAYRTANFTSYEVSKNNSDLVTLTFNVDRSSKPKRLTVRPIFDPAVHNPQISFHGMLLDKNQPFQNLKQLVENVKGTACDPQLHVQLSPYINLLKQNLTDDWWCDPTMYRMLRQVRLRQTNLAELMGLSAPSSK
ncbi:hypothetical protein JQC92_03675 [Shewanella sp. 202IG2-18]|uniref:hypothetical protein n=1 Tax=Parashewanella hymeniacidonis TaxID=2807618 RepID=UPI00196187BC|nr:hypothetical protein [Parashewanella hymeniacidonis]MBM7071140.1 hypothetical protein [Parashewanella hymeniacidonis]